MKAKRRHELQENVLAGELAKLVEFLKKRGSHLATGALVIALVIFAYFIIKGRGETARFELQHQWGQAMTGQAKPQERTRILTTLAEQTDNPRIASLATVELGYDAATRALVAKTDSERTALAENAAKWYRKTITEFPTQTLALAKAHLGMGKLYESKRQLQEAAEEYRQAKASPEMVGQPVVILAQNSLNRLSMLTSPVRMATTMPTTQPTTQATTQATAPAAPPAAPKGRDASPRATQPATAPKS